MGIYRSLCHNFDFVNMTFVKVIFFPMNFYKKIYFHGKFITEFYFFYSHTFSAGCINSFFQKTFFPLV